MLRDMVKVLERPLDRTSEGWLLAFVGVVIFSGSLPATRLAVGGFSPLFLTSARAVIAAVIAACCVIVLRQARPARTDLPSLVIVALGVVIGFPMLTALALERITAAHSIVFIGLLPLSTATFAVIRGGERPGSAFWAWSGAGAATVAGFALVTGGPGQVQGDLLMLAAVVLCGLGYAEGATLSRRLGGWQVISWALVLAAPVSVVAGLATLPGTFQAIPVGAWLGLAYVAVFSMFVGFVFWYRGLALGGIAGAGQLQLLQPFLGLILASVVLGESVAPGMLLATAVVVACVAGARRVSR